jgi:hypothetical protein
MEVMRATKMRRWGLLSLAQRRADETMRKGKGSFLCAIPDDPTIFQQDGPNSVPGDFPWAPKNSAARDSHVRCMLNTQADGKKNSGHD